MSVGGEGVARRRGAVVIATRLITETENILKVLNTVKIFKHLEDKVRTPVSFFETHLTQIVFNKHLKCVGQMTLDCTTINEYLSN